MARVTHVKKARESKHPRVCKSCGMPIEVGTPYKWFATRIGRSSIRKDYHAGCNIPRSAFTTSDKLGQLYDAQDMIDKAYGQGDIVAALEEAAEIAHNVASEYEESADNIESGFGHETYQSQEIREKAEACESWADELESAAGEIEGLDESDVDHDDLLANIANELGLEVEYMIDRVEEGNAPERYDAVREQELGELLGELAQEKAQDVSGALEL